MDRYGLIPKKLAEKYNIVQGNLRGNKLEILARRKDINMIQDIMLVSGKEIILKIVSQEDIDSRMGEVYSVNTTESINSILDNILDKAVEIGASDIHFEPYRTFLRVRLRLDGELSEYYRFEPEMSDKLNMVLKLRANLDITEKRRSQDGRFEHDSEDNPIDCRVSVIPIIDGEKVVIRLLNRRGFLKSREELGFCGRANSMIDHMLKRNHGMIIISGPTGSGKTTTMYTLINEIRKGKNNVVTIEDPVEYRLGGVNQINVDEVYGMGFESSLRAVLRQDPDIIVIGEIRDDRTAKIAVSAANSGHLVITSLHTTNAPSSIVRLIDMGVEPYMINSSLIGIISQRLIRRDLLCRGNERNLTEKNREKYTDDNNTERYTFERDKAVRPTEREKDRKSREINKSGRTIIYEVLDIDEKIKRSIKDGASEDDIVLAAGDISYIDFKKCLEIHGYSL